MDSSGRLNVGRLTRPKVVATMGPACADESTLRQLIAAGMDVARLNFSHGSQDSQRKTFDLLMKLSKVLHPHTPTPTHPPPCVPHLGESKEFEHQVSVMCDIQGPKIRTGVMKAPFELREGDKVRVTCEDIIGDASRFQVRYPGDLVADLVAGDSIFVNDGIVRLIVESKDAKDLVCVCEAGGTISDKKGCNLPTGNLSVALPTPKDVEDLLAICQFNPKPDWIAVSFVGSADDLISIRKLLDANGFPGAKLLSKIERPQALKNLDDIVRHSDAVMVARGDLGVEIPLHEVPTWQRRIIAACAKHARPCVVATQMLESMIHASRPTRAEVTDVYEAVLQGADAVMLSGETSVGAHPVEAVRIMDRIAQEAQLLVKRGESVAVREFPSSDLLPLIASGCEGIVRALTASQKSCQILCISQSGTTAAWLSSLRLPVSILAFTNNEKTMRQFNILWGVRGVLWHKASEPTLSRMGSLALMGHTDSAEKSYFRAIRKAYELELIKATDLVLLVASSLTLGHEGGLNLSLYHVERVLSTEM